MKKIGTCLEKDSNKVLVPIARTQCKLPVQRQRKTSAVRRPKEKVKIPPQPSSAHSTRAAFISKSPLLAAGDAHFGGL
jgi:hypothetical protein